MLIVAGTITVDPGQVDNLRDASTAMMEATLEETGCHQYVFSEKLDQPGTIQIFEIWQSPEELEAHFQTPHMATFQQALAGLTIHSRELHRYEVANITAM
ncbi:MAG: putative quinol monooxygenase [Actinomycetota bacterium]